MRPLYILIGRSGAGKSTVEKLVCQKLPELKRIRSYTTRPQRSENDDTHIFVTPEEFNKLELISYTKYNGHEYGITKETADQSDIFVVDPIGLSELRKKYSERPLVVIWLYTSERILYNRMRMRGDTHKAAKERLRYDRTAFNSFDYDYVVDASCGVDEVASAVLDIIKTPKID